MRKLFAVIIFCCAGNLLYAQTGSLLQYVDPYVGTAPSTTLSATKHGGGTEQRANTIPAVGTPFGMTQWTAQTQRLETKCVPPYIFQDATISGFRGTHWLSGSCVPDYGSFTIMPVVGKLVTSKAGASATFLHTDEVTRPDYYRVKFSNNQLITEITATPRCAIMQFTMNKDDSLYLLAMPNSDKGKGHVYVDRAANEISGYNPAYRIYVGTGKPACFSGYFVIKVERQAANGGVFVGDDHFSTDSIANKKDIGAYLGYKLKQKETLRIKIGTSFTSIAQARKNLEAEIPGWDFNEVLTRATDTWEKTLSKIEITDDNVKNKHIFYTAMYHAMLDPRLYNDVDGTYPQFAHQYKNAQLTGGANYYDDLSMWDIYRAELPLLEILQPKLVNNIVRSFILKGQQGGWMPIFPVWNSYTSAMIGDHGAPFIASAYLKGIADYDIKEAYRLLRQNAFDTPSLTDYEDGKGRRGLDSYLKYGYIPLEDPVKDAPHRNEQVSRTLEYAYDDYALAMMAKALGRQADYKQLLTQSKNYKNVIDPATGLARGRHADGSWITPFDPDKKVSYITEGTPRQYTFYVPQDVAGLTKLMGGKNKLENALDSIFIKDEYWHGNEPGHQTPYMYNFTNAPWKTQQIVDKIRKEEYTDGPGGLSGNDDAGQMSAWYVFAALGFYPVDPVSDHYQLGTPLFKQAVIHMENGHKFVINAIKSNPSAIYIKSIKLNGVAYKQNTVSYKDIAKGGVMDIKLSDSH
ncbi:MAG: GH92 family glycosyl hydrolase [Bacteroidota bacterium]